VLLNFLSGLRKPKKWSLHFINANPIYILQFFYPYLTFYIGLNLIFVVYLLSVNVALVIERRKHVGCRLWKAQMTKCIAQQNYRCVGMTYLLETGWAVEDMCRGERCFER
jgi:hypothetical protein